MIYIHTSPLYPQYNQHCQANVASFVKGAVGQDGHVIDSRQFGHVVHRRCLQSGKKRYGIHNGVYIYMLCKSIYGTYIYIYINMWCDMAYIYIYSIWYTYIYIHIYVVSYIYIYATWAYMVWYGRIRYLLGYIYIYMTIYALICCICIYIYICMLAPHKTNVFPFLVLKVE